MKQLLSKYLVAALLLSSTIAAFTSCNGQGVAQTKKQNQLQIRESFEPEKKKEASESVQKAVDSLSEQRIWEKRAKIMQEALTAIRETENALAALDSGKTEVALAALEKTTGKLEIILAREPKLAHAPISVDVSTNDVLVSLESIKKIKKEAERLLGVGEMQQARALLCNLGSEIVISVTNIPLATYPDAIKAVTPLIDKGKIEQAKIALSNALSTLVVTDHIIPLPIVRAEEMLKKAEKLAENKARRISANDSLSTLMKNARYQLQMAEALGYGEKKDYAEFYNQLDEIEKKTDMGKSGVGFFDSVKTSIGNMKKKIFK